MAFLAIGAAVAAFARPVLADGKQVCNDAYTSAQMLRGAKKLLQARDQLRVCVRAECTWRVADCGKWLGEVEANIPTLVFEAKDGRGNDLSAVKVTMDGQPLADTLEGGSIQVDPGEHRFAFSDADAHAEKTIVVREGERDRHVRVVLGPASAAGQVATASPSAESTADGSTQRTIGFVVGGIGIAGLVVGSVFGALALVDQGTLKGQCPTTSTCPGSQQSEIDTLHLNEVLADVGFGVGVVGVGLGAVLLLTAGPSTPSSTALKVDVGPASIALRGRF
jgi:hypothetical protein